MSWRATTSSELGFGLAWHHRLVINLGPHFCAYDLTLPSSRISRALLEVSLFFPVHPHTSILRCHILQVRKAALDARG